MIMDMISNKEEKKREAIKAINDYLEGKISHDKLEEKLREVI